MNGMEWNGMEWNGMEWNGMEWNGMEWNVWNGMEWNGMEWNGMEWNGFMHGGFTLSGSAVINSPATTTIAETITGGFSLTKTGAGVLILSNTTNSYTGGTIISAGTLEVGAAGAIPTNNVTDNGSLDLNAISTTIDGLSGAGTVDTVAGGTPTLTVGINGGGGTLSGVIQNSSGTLSLAKVGAGTEILSGGYTYSGTTTVAGGTLGLSSGFGVPSTPGSLVISNGSTLAADVSSGNSLPANNLILQDNATINVNYGSLTTNPTAPVINASGSLSAPGSNIVINIAATGLQVGTFTLVKYTGTTPGSLANFQLSPPPGVAAILVNNTGNHSIDIQITSIPNLLSWSGVNGTSWDLITANWSNTVAGGITVFRQYTNGSVIAGDSVVLDDSLTNDFVNPQPTNITLNTTFFAFPVFVNSTLPYSIAGTGGITGVTSLVKSNSGSLTLLMSNSFTGGVFINDAGSLIITNDSALGASSDAVTLNGSTLQINGGVTNRRAISMPVTATIGVATNVTASLGGVISGAALPSTSRISAP